LRPIRFCLIFGHVSLGHRVLISKKARPTSTYICRLCSQSPENTFFLCSRLGVFRPLAMKPCRRHLRTTVIFFVPEKKTVIQCSKHETCCWRLKFWLVFLNVVHGTKLLLIETFWSSFKQIFFVKESNMLICIYIPM
jgi:hypothetical protein